MTRPSVHDVMPYKSPTEWGFGMLEDGEESAKPKSAGHGLAMERPLRMGLDETDADRRGSSLTDSDCGTPRSGASLGMYENCEQTMAAMEEYQSLDPIVRAAREESFCSSLLVCDLTKNSRLSEHFKRYHLTDFFDEKGQRRYQNLSMSFAAKQYAGIQDQFGSTSSQMLGDAKLKSRSAHLSARSYRLSSAMVERDREIAKQRCKDEFRSLNGASKVKELDVKQRQHEMLFLEVADYQTYLPMGVTVEELLPLDVSREQDKHERRRSDKLNACLLEVVIGPTEQSQEYPAAKTVLDIHSKVMDMWQLKQHTILEALYDISSWTFASGLCCSTGVDRSVFCRFVLDLGIVDQDHVPYVWAISVFDQFAKPVRVSGTPDAEYSTNADSKVSEHIAFAPQLCKWDFINVVDAIVRRRCKGNHVAGDEFIAMMQRTAGYLKEEWRAKEREASVKTTVATAFADPEAVLEKVIASQCLIGSSKENQRAQAQSVALAMFGEEDHRSLASESMVWKRNRLISGMLIEPEVLQLVEQFRPVFQDLFLLYTDDPETASPENEAVAANSQAQPTRGMAFVNFVQFCQDFRIVPRLATMHELLRAYNCAECLDYPEKLCGSPTEAPSPTEQMMKEFAQHLLNTYRDFGIAFLSFDTSKNNELRLPEFKAGVRKIGYTGDIELIYRELERNGTVTRQQFLMLEDYLPEGHAKVFAKKDSDASRTRQNLGKLRAGVSQMRGSLSSSSRDRTPSPKLPGRAGRENRTTLSAVSVEAAMGPRSSSRESTSSPKLAGRAGRENRMTLAAVAVEVIKRSSTEKASPRSPPNETERTTPERAPPCKAVFGVGAFVESICRIGLTYLLVHGNSVQLATSSRAKMVWLLAYLQATFEGLRQSIGRRLESRGSKRPVTRERCTLMGAGLTLPAPPRSPSPLSPRHSVDLSHPPGRSFSPSPALRPDSEELPPVLTAKLKGAPRGVSQRLTEALERFTPEVFKALQPMELQLNRYNPGIHQSEGAAAFKPERPARVSTKESASQRKQRRKSRHKKELATELMLMQATGGAGILPESPWSTPSPSRQCTPSATEAEEVPPEGRRSLKDIIRPMMDKMRESKTFGSRLAEKMRLQEQESQLSMPGQASPAKKKVELRCLSPDSDTEPNSEHPKWIDSGFTPRKTPHNLGIPTEILEKIQDQQKEDIVRNAIEARPDVPELKDDGFKFDDVLFKRLLRAVSPHKQKPPKSKHERSTTPSPRETTLTSWNWNQAPAQSSERKGRDGHLTSGSGPGSRPATVGHAPQGRSPDLLPPMTPLAKDRGNLIKGLSTCIGKIDRCNLSPPPMNAYAMQLSERIEQMMGRTEAAPRKKLNFTSNEV